MKLLNLYVRNVKKVSEMDIDTEGRHLILVGGKNAQGKSSTIDALIMAICGKRHMAEVPLRDGEEYGEIVIKLTSDENDLTHAADNFTVTRTFERTRDGGIKHGLKITDSDGQESPSPQTSLDGLFSTSALNPLTFETATPAKQREQLLDLVDLSDFFDETTAEYKELYSQRTDCNKAGKRLKAQHDGMEKHKGVPDEEVEVVELMRKWNDAKDYNRDGKRDIKQIEVLTKVEAETEASISKLQAKLTDATSEKAGLLESTKGFEEVDTLSLLKAVSEAGDVNSKVSDNKLWAAKKLELDDLRSESNDLNEKLTDVLAKQHDALRDANWPVDGLSVDSEGLLFNKLPLAQASQSERIRLCCRITAALNPALKLFVVYNGNDLDHESLQELDEFLCENDFQAIVEYVTRSELDEQKCTVVLHDGAEKEVAGAV